MCITAFEWNSFLHWIFGILKHESVVHLLIYYSISLVVFTLLNLIGAHDDNWLKLNECEYDVLYSIEGSNIWLDVLSCRRNVSVIVKVINCLQRRRSVLQRIRKKLNRQDVDVFNSLILPVRSWYSEGIIKLTSNCLTVFYNCKRFIQCRVSFEALFWFLSGSLHLVRKLNELKRLDQAERIFSSMKDMWFVPRAFLEYDPPSCGSRGHTCWTSAIESYVMYEFMASTVWNFTRPSIFKELASAWPGSLLRVLLVVAEDLIFRLSLGC